MKSGWVVGTTSNPPAKPLSTSHWALWVTLFPALSRSVSIVSV